MPMAIIYNTCINEQFCVDLNFQAGGTSGITVDMALFPLDTLKTRLQSPYGFFASGGFQHLYKGVGTAAVGSVPSGT
jgi:hypothetical protein